MHEMSLMTQVFDIINQTVAFNNVTQVRRVTLKVGKMANVVPDCLSFCFEILSQGTKCQGAELVMEEVPVTVECRECGKEFSTEGFPLICPVCGSSNTGITGGTEITVDSLEIDEEAEQNGN